MRRDMNICLMNYLGGVCWTWTIPGFPRPFFYTPHLPSTYFLLLILFSQEMRCLLITYYCCDRSLVHVRES